MNNGVIASDPKNSCWVFASAGSGKTKILVDRVVRLLLADVSPNKIFCLTFTKAAAAEMQERINSRLAELVLVSDEELQKKLQELSGKFPSADLLKKARTLFVKILDDEARVKVQTIHAFCQTLIKIFPFESQVKPSFEILEDSREKLMMQQAQKEVLRNALEDEALRNLVVRINANLHDESLSDLLSGLLDKKEKLDFEVTEIYEKLSLSPQDNDQEIFQKFLQKLNHAENLQLALDLENTKLATNQEIANKIRIFCNEPKLENFSTYQSAFFTDKNEPRKIRGKTAESLMDIALKQCDLISQFSDKINSLNLANDTALLLEFTNYVLASYAKLKQQRALLDYNDLIIETNRLLANPDFSDWVKMKMDGSFDHILIDESQDTNRQQWSIIKALCEDFFSGLSLSNQQRSIFIVGDEKQSIFSFQGAEPDISSEIFSYFKNKFGDQFKKIELHHSFRSRAEILAAVDKVFLDPERKAAISKASEFSGHLITREGKGLVEIWPKAKKEIEKQETSYEWQINYQKTEQSEQEILAEIISKKITIWAQERQVNYGDIMILLRTRTNGFFDELVKSFHRHQIPFTSISRVRFSKSLLIQDLLAAARFVLLPQDDLNLACLLKSPIFDFSEDELLKICLKKNADETTIYKALIGSTTREKLEELIAKSQQVNCFKFFYFILYEQNHRQNFLSYFGHESLEMLDKFIISVSNFCENSSPNLQKFLEFVEEVDPEISLSAVETNRVRISTIHGAKGLQAKIVLLPDCSYDLRRSPSAKEKILWIDGLPIWCAKKSYENKLIRTHREVRLKEIAEESLRLLYVGMTRAEDELYISGFGNSTDPDSWYEILSTLILPKEANL
jgi:ATP-dependent helicase/nuclease subunit A